MPLFSRRAFVWRDIYRLEDNDTILEQVNIEALPADQAILAEILVLSDALLMEMSPECGDVLQYRADSLDLSEKMHGFSIMLVNYDSQRSEMSSNEAADIQIKL